MEEDADVGPGRKEMIFKWLFPKTLRELNTYYLYLMIKELLASQQLDVSLLKIY